MDLTITATVTVLATEDDMLEVAKRLGEAANGWYGGLTFVPGDAGAVVWQLKLYRSESPQGTETICDTGTVVVTDTNFVSVYSSVSEYNSAHPDHQITES